MPPNRKMQMWIRSLSMLQMIPMRCQAALDGARPFAHGQMDAVPMVSTLPEVAEALVGQPQPQAGMR